MKVMRDLVLGSINKGFETGGECFQVDVTVVVNQFQEGDFQLDELLRSENGIESSENISGYDLLTLNFLGKSNSQENEQSPVGRLQLPGGGIQKSFDKHKREDSDFTSHFGVFEIVNEELHGTVKSRD
eukprot:CAMPEP_0115007344 /NCGR_PEP_ID=MMETSP0216-20121206/21113_1 /TAXON_ID=223996 /ORGANISM="Protocruzia adherens, Strain Boccale" /LENGTH=127 /DNA_ID=CAMNT_0002374247 /DNA_START=228 /DNA_END=611 /DNA_ORIENTATION=-